MFPNDFVSNVAAYNASCNAVKKWKETRFKGDYITFVEMIPYAETQGYVKLVLRNYLIYLRLESGKDFYFPENLLK